MPLPELRDIDKAERAKALREISKRLQLSADTLPSICHYTVLNSCSSVCSIDITDDSSMIALGFADSTVKVLSIYLILIYVVSCGGHPKIQVRPATSTYNAQIFEWLLSAFRIL